METLLLIEELVLEYLEKGEGYERDNPRSQAVAQEDHAVVFQFPKPAVHKRPNYK